LTELLLGGPRYWGDLRRDSVLDPGALGRTAGCPPLRRGLGSPFRGDVEALVELLPAGRQVQVLPGGHALHLDAPEVLARAVREFLDGLDAARWPRWKTDLGTEQRWLTSS